MSVLVLNTHEVVKRLVKAGQDEKAAEAIVEVITEVHEQVVTKGDLKNEIEKLEQRLTNKLLYSCYCCSWSIGSNKILGVVLANVR